MEPSTILAISFAGVARHKEPRHIRAFADAKQVAFTLARAALGTKWLLSDSH